MSLAKSIIEADKIYEVASNLPDLIFKKYEDYYMDVMYHDGVMSLMQFVECLYPNVLREAMKEAGL